MKNRLAVVVTAALLTTASAYGQDKPAATAQSSPATGTQEAPGAAPQAAAPAAPALNPAFKSTAEQNGYALGMEIGTAMRKQGMEVDATTFGKGFSDAFTGGKTVLSDDEMRTVLTAAQQAYQKKQIEIREAKATAAQKEGDDFLATNKAKEGVVALPSGLQYKVLKAGDGKKPDADDTVVCNYRGTFIDGTEFDSSAKHDGPATFPVKGVIKGWTEALQLMPVGSKWQLFVPAQLAYGDNGAGQVIPPNTALIFEVELVSIKDKPKDEKPQEATPPAADKPQSDKPQSKDSNR
jgi:FKBP-type peptidyl-prolyl cis-trans isomerase FklB